MAEVKRDMLQTACGKSKQDLSNTAGLECVLLPMGSTNPPTPVHARFVAAGGRSGAIQGMGRTRELAPDCPHQSIGQWRPGMHRTAFAERIEVLQNDWGIALWMVADR